MVEKKQSFTVLSMYSQFATQLIVTNTENKYLQFYNSSFSSVLFHWATEHFEIGTHQFDILKHLETLFWWCSFVILCPNNPDEIVIIHFMFKCKAVYGAHITKSSDVATDSPLQCPLLFSSSGGVSRPLVQDSFLRRFARAPPRSARIGLRAAPWQLRQLVCQPLDCWARGETPGRPPHTPRSAPGIVDRRTRTFLRQQNVI